MKSCHVSKLSLTEFLSNKYKLANFKVFISLCTKLLFQRLLYVSFREAYAKTSIDVIINGVIYDRNSSRYISAVISRTVWFGRRWKRLAWLWLDEADVGSSSLSERKEQPGASGSGKWREDEMRQDGTRELGTTKSLSSDEVGRNEGEETTRWDEKQQCRNEILPVCEGAQSYTRICLGAL